MDDYTDLLRRLAIGDEALVIKWRSTPVHSSHRDDAAHWASTYCRCL